jgi:hypothetical protein
MKYDRVTSIGPNIIQRVTTLPAWSIDDVGRIMYTLDTKKFYIGKSSDWEEVGSGSGISSHIRNVDSWGDGILQLSLPYALVVNMVNHGGTPRARITSYQAILNLSGGTPPYRYITQNIPGPGGSLQLPKLDPKTAYTTYNYIDVGISEFLIGIMDADSNMLWCYCPVLVQDNMGY